MNRLLVLLRHGQSDWNLKNLFTGWKDPDLTPAGIEEAKEAARRLKAIGVGFDIAFTSVLVRAQNTTKITLAELGQSPKVVEDAALNERDYGDLSGLNKAEAAKKWGEEQVMIWRRSYAVPPPGGESLRDTLARALPFYCQEILPCVLRGERTLVVAHGNSLQGAVDGARTGDAADHSRHRARNRRSGGLHAQSRFDRRIETGAARLRRARQLRQRVGCTNSREVSSMRRAFSIAAGRPPCSRPLREVLRAAPLFTPTMPRTGKKFSVAMSNCGPLGWVSDRDGGYRYQARHPVTGAPWPDIPQIAQDAWQALADHPRRRKPVSSISMRPGRAWPCIRIATRPISPRPSCRCRSVTRACSGSGGASATARRRA